jgi:hypothetical protein
VCLDFGKHCKQVLPLGWESACIVADCYVAIATKKYILPGPLIFNFVGLWLTHCPNKLVCLAFGKNCKLLLPLGWQNACIVVDLAIAKKKYIFQGSLILNFLGLWHTVVCNKLIYLALGKHSKLVLPLGWESACVMWQQTL